MLEQLLFLFQESPDRAFVPSVACHQAVDWIGTDPLRKFQVLVSQPVSAVMHERVAYLVLGHPVVEYVQVQAGQGCAN
jgi:hypothetical protein